MPKDKRVRASSGPAKPKKLRKQLRKAEADLAKAQRKRDEAVARVQALGIIADEIRAQLAEVEPVESASDASASKPSPAVRAKKPAARKTAGARKTAAITKPAPATRPSTAAKPAITRKPAAGKSASATRKAATVASESAASASEAPASEGQV